LCSPIYSLKENLDQSSFKQYFLPLEEQVDGNQPFTNMAKSFPILLLKKKIASKVENVKGYETLTFLWSWRK
jgi:hypothetical protein